MPKEVWRSFLKKYEGIYQISNKARVRSVKSGRILVQLDNGNDYKFVYVYKNSKPEKFYIHRLLCMAFKKKAYCKQVVNHKSGNKSRNTLKNCEWMSYRRNTKHAWDNGLIKRRKRKKR